MSINWSAAFDEAMGRATRSNRPTICSTCKHNTTKITRSRLDGGIILKQEGRCCDLAGHSSIFGIVGKLCECYDWEICNTTIIKPEENKNEEN